MHIKSIVLDGFKSYAQRTEIHGFDQLFNAITGLNGSGKSNILDSICFLLGITNLTHVRATNLQDLIYKSGQAGVTKATVTILFDNINKEQSPLGYETFDEITISRQIVLGGRNKYLINGCNAQNTRVQDLFRSIQLNINNPHFLIMQGRITKVLNMKPAEILSMLEEAAGTRLYETKKQQAFKTIEKKDMKLGNIESVLTDEITPSIDKLKEERSSYLLYQKIVRDIEHLTRLYVAYEFFKIEEVQSKSTSTLQTMLESMEALQQRNQEIEGQIKEIEMEIAKQQKNKDQESGSILKDLEKKLDEVTKLEVKASSDVKHAEDSLTCEKKKVNQLEKNMAENEKQLNIKSNTIAKSESELKELEKSSVEDEEAAKEAEKHFHAVSAGLSSNKEGEDKTLANQLMECQNIISKSDTESKQIRLKLKNEEVELKQKQALLNSDTKAYSKDQAALQNLKKEREAIELEQRKLNSLEERAEEIQQKKQQLEDEISRIQKEIGIFEAKFPHLQFSYNDPNSTFDRTKVKGLVCNLIKVEDTSYSTGLEVAAGNKLYNVIVDTEKTGKLLLEKGNLRRKVTLIPLNNIASRFINQNTVKRAKDVVGKDNVHMALSLVGYDNDLEAAMKYVFGGTFVAKLLEHAKKVAFDPQVKTRTVTKSGDVFDPAGTLSGGARRNQAPVLMKIKELQDANNRLKRAKSDLIAVDKEVQSHEKAAARLQELSEKLQVKSREMELIEQRLKQSSHHKKAEEMKTNEESIAKLKEILDCGKEAKKNASEKCRELEQKIQELSSHRDKEVNEADDLLSGCKKKAEMSIKTFKKRQQELAELRLEIDAIKEEYHGLKEQVKEGSENICTIEQNLGRLTEIANLKMEDVKKVEKNFHDQKEALRLCHESITALSKEKGQLLKEGANVQLNTKELSHKTQKHKKEAQEAKEKVEYMLEKYEWIESEKQYFGQANSDYDFEKNDPKAVSLNLKKLNDKRGELEKTVNMRAMNMLGKAEERYQDLLKRKKMVETDKSKIEDLIKDLDDRKNKQLEKAWLKVNKDFASIFSTLLPGSTAKLSPPEGMNVLDGLEVKVAFGNVWKQSLAELSGGQRSLVALSLILSLLLFKPAPIYILDEVDAALDQSHTQNIGEMLRAHFKHSQFIVVSLKDGMFNNANVLFKTKFVDGVSTVARFVQNQKSALKNSNVVNTTTKKSKTGR